MSESTSAYESGALLVRLVERLLLHRVGVRRGAFACVARARRVPPVDHLPLALAVSRLRSNLRRALLLRGDGHEQCISARALILYSRS